MENKIEAETLLLSAIETHQHSLDEAEKRLSQLREQALEEVLKAEKATKCIHDLKSALQTLQNALPYSKQQ